MDMTSNKTRRLKGTMRIKGERRVASKAKRSKGDQRRRNRQKEKKKKKGSKGLATSPSLPPPQSERFDRLSDLNRDHPVRVRSASFHTPGAVEGLISLEVGEQVERGGRNAEVEERRGPPWQSCLHRVPVSFCLKVDVW